MKKLDHNQFITDMMRFASSAESPERIINQILQYICENLDSDRAYIFENNNDGTFDNTYEFCREGVSAEIDNLQNVPYDGLLDVWFAEYEKSRTIMIYDIEEYRPTSEAVYQILKPQNVTSLVTGPIEINGKYVGFYGVDNPPIEIIKNISTLIDMMEFVIEMMIKLRDYSRKLENYAKTDQLTSCKNRAALEWAYDGQFNTDKPIGVIMCDLNGLKKRNDTYGHEAGDVYLCDAAEVLQASFGKENVYRVGGDEFVVVILDETKELIECNLSKARIYCELKKVSISMGLSYRKNAKEPFEMILREADKLMYLEKQNYYDTEGR